MARISRKKPLRNEAALNGAIYDVGIYLRLSVEDARKKASDSIGTQKALLLQYLERHKDMRLIETYQDVNYSGTDFDRPGFTRMIEDAKSKKINCIIVKDLSRFGRNYLETGTYLEYIFPLLNLRFISVNDGFDSFAPDNTSGALLVPVKNLMNELYARDISKKAKSQYAIKRQHGEFCGSFAAYGYIKTGSRLIVDETAAETVREIYSLAAEGLSDSAIAKALNSRAITPPGRYGWEKGIMKGEKYRRTVCWHHTAVARILTNPIYTGTMIGGKYQRLFFSGNGVKKPTSDNKNECKDTHAAIISDTEFNALQVIRNSRRALAQCGGGK